MKGFLDITQKNKLLICEFLKEARLAAKLSQKKVANALGYTTPQFVSNWERGMILPPKTTIPLLVHLYKIDVEEFFEVYMIATNLELAKLLKMKPSSKIYVEHNGKKIKELQ